MTKQVKSDNNLLCDMTFPVAFSVTVNNIKKINKNKTQQVEIIIN